MAIALSTYYTILGVSETATQESIKSAYRKRLKKIHPDMVATLSPELRHEAQEVTQEIIEAYSVLMDANRRAEYDRDLANSRQRVSRIPTSRQKRTVSYAPPIVSRTRRSSSNQPSRPRSAAGKLKILGAALTACLLLGVLLPSLVGIGMLFLDGYLSIEPHQYSAYSVLSIPKDVALGFALIELPIVALLFWYRYRIKHRTNVHTLHLHGWLVGILLAAFLNAIYLCVAFAVSINDLNNNDSSRLLRPGEPTSGLVVLSLPPAIDAHGCDELAWTIRPSTPFRSAFD
jgi:curved DNA-binding protein CbpA